MEENIRWIDVITRPLTDEEKRFFWENLIDADDAYIFDCPVPWDGEEVLVMTDDGKTEYDTFIKSLDGDYFENHLREGEVVAWARSYVEDCDGLESGLLEED